MRCRKKSLSMCHILRVVRGCVDNNENFSNNISASLLRNQNNLLKFFQTQNVFQLSFHGMFLFYIIHPPPCCYFITNTFRSFFNVLSIIPYVICRCFFLRLSFLNYVSCRKFEMNLKQTQRREKKWMDMDYLYVLQAPGKKKKFC